METVHGDLSVNRVAVSLYPGSPKQGRAVPCPHALLFPWATFVYLHPIP